MSMGYHAAFNIHQHLLSQRNGIEAKPMIFPEIPPMIAIAIGKKAIMLSPVDGTTSGPDVLEMMFRDDLGFASEWKKVFRRCPLLTSSTVCWNYLQLGIDPTSSPVEAEVVQEKGQDLEMQVTAIDTTCAKMESLTV